MGRDLLGNVRLVFAFLPGALMPLAGLPGVALAFDEHEFEISAGQHVQRYGDFATQQAVHQLLIEGHVDAYFERLATLVPDEDKGFYDYFVLGNLLFAEDRDRSYAYMKRAEELQPTNPYVLYERGIHEHRNGNCADAVRYYRKFHGSAVGEDNPVSWAYLTHCELLLGDSDAALASWQNADFGRNHTAIEKGMYVIFSSNRPNRTRQTLIARIEAGEHQLLCDLIGHDENWELDWWNSIAKEDYLSFDRVLADRVLQAGSTNEKVVSLCLASGDLSDEEFVDELVELQLWGESAVLPHSPLLVYEMARRLSAAGLADPEEILQVFGSQLEARLAAHPGERRYAEVLGFLYSATDRKAQLHEIDYHGWHELKIDRFAASYLLGMDPASAEYASKLDEAAADFPNSPHVNRLRMAELADEPERNAAIARYVASEFANVRENWAGPYRLNDFMASLAYEIRRSANP